jgi:hypothetical protein
MKPPDIRRALRRLNLGGAWRELLGTLPCARRLWNVTLGGAVQINIVRSLWRRLNAATLLQRGNPFLWATANAWIGAALWIVAGTVQAQDAPGSFPAEGIASKYPGDVGIEHDPQVVFVEKFEQETLAALWPRWETVRDQAGMSFSEDVPPGSPGSQSLLMERTSGSGAHLYRRLPNSAGGWGYDRIFARYYIKFDPDCGEIHHLGTCIGGNFPASPHPLVRAGHPPDGARSFWSGIEPYGRSWTWDFYTYWAEMRGSPPQGRTWGNSFIRDPALNVEKGRWLCVEQMIQMNDPDDSNGEQALWIDGRLAGHFGRGFPHGLWVYDKFAPGQGGQSVRWNHEKGGPERFTIPQGGAPFEGFRWRTIPELNVNFIWLYIYTELPPGHRIRVSFDHVVVATDYIGPLHPQ